MGSSNSQTADESRRRVKRLGEYKRKIASLLPNLPETLPRNHLDSWLLGEANALAIACFLECYPRKAFVLDIGTFFGASSFYFATHPKVLRVLSIDPNPLIVDEINDKLALGQNTSIGSGPLQGLRVLDIAESALADFPEERRKVQFRAGVVGSHQVAVQGGSLNNLERIIVPVLEPSEEASLIAFVDGLHTKEGVQTDLEAVFERNPHAIALLDDCQGYWGPAVQAGVASFMESAEQKYHFHLFEHLRDRLGPDLALPSLGVIFPDLDAAEIEQVLLKMEQILVESALRKTPNHRQKQVDWQCQRAEQVQKRPDGSEAGLVRVHDGKHQELKRALREERQKTQRLRKQNQRLTLRVQNLDRKLQDIQGSRTWKMLKRLSYVQAKVSRK